jgi:hypothetical protein
MSVFGSIISCRFGKQRIIKCCAIISQNVVNRENNRVHNHRSAWNNASKYGHEA